MPGSDAECFDRHLKALWRCGRSDNSYRALAISTEHRLKQVCLFGFGWKSGRRTTALHIDDYDRKLGHHREANGFTLEREAWTAGAGQSKIAGERGADGRAHRRYFVFGLKSFHAKVLVNR